MSVSEKLVAAKAEREAKMRELDEECEQEKRRVPNAAIAFLLLEMEPDTQPICAEIRALFDQIHGLYVDKGELDESVEDQHECVDLDAEIEELREEIFERYKRLEAPLKLLSKREGIYGLEIDDWMCLPRGV